MPRECLQQLEHIFLAHALVPGNRAQYRVQRSEAQVLVTGDSDLVVRRFLGFKIM
jgi:hypothetical protein